MQSPLQSIPNPEDEAPLCAAIQEQKFVFANLVSVGKSAVRANATLYELTDTLFRMRSAKAS